MTPPDSDRALRHRSARRFDRQFEMLYRQVPALRGPLTTIRARGWWLVRVPLGLAFIIGGLFAILPFLGLWMIPVGLLLLAVDLPFLRDPVSRAAIRGRRRLTLLWRRWRRR